MRSSRVTTPEGSRKYVLVTVGTAVYKLKRTTQRKRVGLMGLKIKRYVQLPVESNIWLDMVNMCSICVDWFSLSIVCCTIGTNNSMCVWILTVDLFTLTSCIRLETYNLHKFKGFCIFIVLFKHRKVCILNLDIFFSVLSCILWNNMHLLTLCDECFDIIFWVSVSCFDIIILSLF